MSDGHFDRAAKIVGAIVGAGTIISLLVGFVVWLSGRASASSVHVIENRTTALEQQRIDEIEWRRWLAEQVGQISMRLGAPVIPPPSASMTPREGDGPRR